MLNCYKWLMATVLDNTEYFYFLRKLFWTELLEVVKKNQQNLENY